MDELNLKRQLGVLAAIRFVERWIGQPLDGRIGMAGQALLDAIDEGLDSVEEIRPHAAAEVEQNEPPRALSKTMTPAGSLRKS